MPTSISSTGSCRLASHQPPGPSQKSLQLLPPLSALPTSGCCYLDDILVLSSSHQAALRDLDLVRDSLQCHGFSLNLEKSHMQPTTRILHLGAIIDSVSGHVFLSQDHRRSIVNLIFQVLSSRSFSLLLLSQLLGKLISCINIVPWACLHSRPLQWYLLPFQRSLRSNSRARVRLPRAVS